MEALILPEIDFAKCTCCGVCEILCPEHAIEVQDTGPVFIRPQACIYCGLCESSCPEHAVILRYAIVWEDLS
ncbi:MAG: 4Fe-4S binding protein [Anaerolineae bacterium]|nr:4Fe-4S binding protein [Anaerolineae bacterium]